MNSYLEIREQQEWIAAHGGDLEGYRQHYAANAMTYRNDPFESIDAIYYADVNTLRKLQGVPQSVIEQENAVRILGEDYFA